MVDLDARTIRLNVGPSNVSYGISSGKDVLELHGALETPLSAGSGTANGSFVYTVIFIQQQDLYVDPVPVVDGFLYDETGNTSQAMTRITDQ